MQVRRFIYLTFKIIEDHYSKIDFLILDIMGNNDFGMLLLGLGFMHEISHQL